MTYEPKPQTIITLSRVIIALCVIGLIDAAYLTIKHYLGTPLVCGPALDCDLVTTSRFATIGPIPVSALGVWYYFQVGLLATIALVKQRLRYLALAAQLTVIGLIASVFFVYLQLFVIHAICPYCMTSAADSTIMFGLSIPLLIWINQLKGNQYK